MEKKVKDRDNATNETKTTTNTTFFQVAKTNRLLTISYIVSQDTLS